MSEREPSGDPGPFFVFGCGRSGSSLLARMLDAHPRIAVPFESHLFLSFAGWVERYGDLRERRRLERLVDDALGTEPMREWRPPPDREAVLRAVRTPDLGGLVEAVLRTWAEARGKPRYGEKTPDHLLHWRLVLELFPRTRIVHIVRDGRDVALSWVRAPFGPKTTYAAARRWRAYLDEAERLERAAGAGRFLQVRYEDLLAAPEAVLRRVTTLLGEEFSAAMLEFWRNPSPYDTDARNRDNLRKPLLGDNAERWRREMRPRDLRLFECVAGDVLERLGYPRELPPRRLSPAEEAWHRWVEHPPRKLAAILRNPKGRREAATRWRQRARLLFGR